MDGTGTAGFGTWSEADLDAALACGALADRSALIVGEATRVLGKLPPSGYQTCVTSPPYWYVRNYDVDGQLGLEADINDYIYGLVRTFAQVHRVLRPDGTLWVNIGDGYTSGGRTKRAPDKKNRNREMGTRPATPPLLKPKDLLGVPWRLAHALLLPWLCCRSCGSEEHAIRWGAMPSGARICPACLAADPNPDIARDGWYLRSEIIWERTNCQPESVRDRPTRAHEHIFLLAKQEKYVYDNQALRGPNGRNMRTVWQINTQPGQSGHIAPFPEALVEPCLQLASRVGDTVLDPFAGSATTGVVAMRMGRRFVGIELNPGYARIAETRLNAAGLSGIAADPPIQAGREKPRARIATSTVGRPVKTRRRAADNHRTRIHARTR